MGLQALTPNDSPVTLQQVKTALRLVNDLPDNASSDDAALSLILTAAVEHIQTETRQQFCTRQFLYTADHFPNDHVRRRQLAIEEYSFAPFTFEGTDQVDRVIKLPKPPLQSVQSISYLDTTGTLQVLPSGQYVVDVTTRPGRIVLNPGNAWPQTNNAANCVQITFTAGYGNYNTTPSCAFVPRRDGFRNSYSSGDTMPVLLQQAIILLCGSWFENREDTQFLRTSSIPIGVQAIINSNMFPEAVG